MRRGACALLALLLGGASARWPWQKQQPDGGAALPPTPMNKFRWPWQRESSAVATTTTICQGKSCPGDAAAANPTCSSSDVAGAGSCMIPMLPAGTWDGISWIIDPSGHLSDEARDALEQNLTKFNRTAGLRMHVLIIEEIPLLEPPVSPREFAKKLLREWFQPRMDKYVLLLVVPPIHKCEVAMGPKGKRKMKESHVRRITKKVQSRLAAGTTVEAALKMGVKELTTALSQKEGVLGNLRSMIMPIIVVFVLLFMCAAPRPARCSPGQSPAASTCMSLTRELAASSLCAPFVGVSSGT